MLLCVFGMQNHTSGHIRSQKVYFFLLLLCVDFVAGLACLAAGLACLAVTLTIDVFIVPFGFDETKKRKMSQV